MTYLLIYLLIISLVLPYALILVSVNRTDDGEQNSPLSSNKPPPNDSLKINKNQSNIVLSVKAF